MFNDDAEQRTRSWRLRHSPEARATLGAWRWLGMQRHMDRILELCVGKTVIDFGGADGGLGLGSVVVDLRAELQTLDDYHGMADVIFTSHTLEHLDQPGLWMLKASDKLNAGGYVIIHVPSWTCRRWCVPAYHSETQSPHLHTFGLLSDGCGEPIDAMAAMPFEIELAEHCGDNSILVIGRKRDN